MRWTVALYEMPTRSFNMQSHHWIISFANFLWTRVFGSPKKQRIEYPLFVLNVCYVWTKLVRLFDVMDHGHKQRLHLNWRFRCGSNFYVSIRRWLIILSRFRNASVPFGSHDVNRKTFQFRAQQNQRQAKYFARLNFTFVGGYVAIANRILIEIY